MKKILLLLICAQMLLAPLPVLAEGSLALDYDFSDDAQQVFDQQKFTPINEINSKDFKVKVKGKEIKTNTNLDYSPVTDVPKSQYILPTNAPLTQQTLIGSVVTVPAGTPIKIKFDSGVSSGSMDKDDRIIAVLSEDWIYRGLLLAPAGSLVYGVSTDANSATYAYGSGSMELTFNQILLESGKMIDIATEKIYIKADSKRALKMTRDVVIGAGIGILAALVLGSISSSDNRNNDIGRSMIMLGGMGALGGGIRGASQRGEDVAIPDGTRIEIKLLNPISISPYI